MITTPPTAASGEENASALGQEARGEVPASEERSVLDRVGVVASVTCAVHCAATPLLIAVSPAFKFIADERVEWALFASVLVIGLSALLPSYFRRHHDLTPILTYAAGVAVLLVARFLPAGAGIYETIAAVGGALLVATAHLLNLRRTRACAAEHHDHSHHHGHSHSHPHGGHGHHH